ncbi:hypothetical protein GCM10023075_66920 [Streptosporangium album]|uniref:hypothetical protein n=1 Tax=Streptosporangium album TaxID=47479 RepID=UPI0031E5E291
MHPNSPWRIADFRFLLTGALATGSAVAGLIGELVTVHTTLWVGGAFLAVAFLPVFLSPVRTRLELPQRPPVVNDVDASHGDGRTAPKASRR